MVFVTNKFLAILFLLPGGALAVRGTSSVPPTTLPGCRVEELSVLTREVKKMEKNYASKSYGVNQLLSPMDAIELDEVAFIGRQWIESIDIQLNEGTPRIRHHIHCTGLDGETESDGDIAEHTYEKPVCDLEICFEDQPDELNDCIQMRYISDRKEQTLRRPGYYGSSSGDYEVTPEPEPEPIVGAVIGGTGQYSNVIGGEFLVPQFFQSYDDVFEFKLIVCSDESTSSPTTNDEQAPIQERIDDFQFSITNVDASLGFENLRTDVAIGEFADGIAKITKTGTLAQDENPSDDSNKFITIHCTVLAGRRLYPVMLPEVNHATEEQTCNFDLVYGNDEQGEPNSIFLKAIADLFENYEFPVGDAGEGVINVRSLSDAPDFITIDATVLGGTGIYRSAGGKARITLNSISGTVSVGTVSADNPLQTGTIQVELNPYYTGVDLWGDRKGSY